MDDLYKLPLVDGLPVESAGRTIRYRIAHLRETTVADERIAQRQAERVVSVAGKPTLLVSDADFRFALTARHIEAFECDGQRIPQAIIDLELVGKLSPHDLGLIEQRVLMIEMAAEVRYGNLTQAEFDALMGGKATEAASPQPVGQDEGMGLAAAQPGPGPALLADFTGEHPESSPARHVR